MDWRYNPQSFAVISQDPAEYHFLPPTTPKSAASHPDSVLVRDPPRDRLPRSNIDILTQGIDSRLALLQNETARIPLDALSSVDFYAALYSLPFESRKPRRTMSKSSSLKTSPTMKKQRSSSLQLLLNTLLPTSPTNPSDDGEYTPRSQVNSTTAGGAGGSDEGSLGSWDDYFPPSTAATSPRDSPPLDFLLDDDPFANLTSPAVPGSRNSSIPVPPLPLLPEVVPLPPPPRSRLMPATEQLPRKSLARANSTEATSPKTRPRAISGARTLQPAYQRPAFSPRPSLPSLSTLAKMNVVLTKKVRKGRVGARLPFEPWDNPPSDVPPRVLQDVDGSETASLPPGTQPLLPSQLLPSSSSSASPAFNVNTEAHPSHVCYTSADNDVEEHYPATIPDIEGPNLSYNNSDSGHDVIDMYYSGEGHESEILPAIGNDQGHPFATTTEPQHESSTTTTTNTTAQCSDDDFYPTLSSQVSSLGPLSPDPASLSRSVSISSKSSASSYGGADVPVHYHHSGLTGSSQDALDGLSLSSSGNASRTSFEDGSTSPYYHGPGMTTRSSSEDSDSLLSPPDSEYRYSPFNFTSTSYFPPYASPIASVDRVASWRMSNQAAGGLSSYLSDLDLEEPFQSPNLNGYSNVSGGEQDHEVTNANIHADGPFGQPFIRRSPKFTLHDSEFAHRTEPDSFTEAPSNMVHIHESHHKRFPGHRLQEESDAGSCPSSADTVRPLQSMTLAGSGAAEDHDYRYAHSSYPSSSGSEHDSFALFRASVIGVEDGGYGPGLGRQESWDQLSLASEPKKEALNLDGMMPPPISGFDNDHDNMHRSQRIPTKAFEPDPRNMDYGYGFGYGDTVDGAGRESGNSGDFRGYLRSNQDHAKSGGYTAGSSSHGHYANGWGRGDDDDDGRDDRRRRLDRTPYGHAVNATATSSSVASASVSEDEDSDDYGHPSDYRNNQVSPSTANAATNARFPTSGSLENSDDDDIPLAQRIPTALTAQKSIRKQVREERIQRRAQREREQASAHGESSGFAIRERERHATLRPVGAGGPLLPPLALSSSQEAAMLAGAGSAIAQPPLPSEPASTRLTMPSKPAASSNPFSAEDLAKRLQNVQVLTDYQRQQHVPSSSVRQAPPPPYETVYGQGGIMPKTSLETPERSPAVADEHARKRSVREVAGSPANLMVAKSSLRPKRSFHHADRRPALDDHRAVPPAPADPTDHRGTSLSRQTTTVRPQGRARGESVSAGSSSAQPPVGRYRSLSISRGAAHPSSGFDDFGAPLPPVPPLPKANLEEQQQLPRKLLKPHSTPHTTSGRTSMDHDHRTSVTKSPVHPTATLPTIDKTQIVQQRIFIGDMQRFNMVELAPSTTAGDVVEMIEAQGSLKGIIGSGGWMVWEVAQDFGMERPIRSFELMSDVQASWNKDKTVNLFVLKLTPLSAHLSRSAIPSSSPTHCGYVEWEVKRGKWSKRWMELREHCIWLSKREGKDEVMLCSLSSFDAYHITRSHRSPKPFAFAVKSTDNLSYFEDASDYLHTFSCSEKDGRIWMEKILVARSYVLHQERQVLFNPKVPGGNAASGVHRSATTGGRRSTSNRPAAPLISVPPPYSAQPTGPVFEPGSLLSGQP